MQLKHNHQITMPLIYYSELLKSDVDFLNKLQFQFEFLNQFKIYTICEF